MRRRTTFTISHTSNIFVRIFFLFSFHIILAQVLILLSCLFFMVKSFLRAVFRDFNTNTEEKDEKKNSTVKRCLINVCAGSYFAIQSTHFHFVLSLVSSLFTFKSSSSSGELQSFTF